MTSDQGGSQGASPGGFWSSVVSSPSQEHSGSPTESVRKYQQILHLHQKAFNVLNTQKQRFYNRPLIFSTKPRRIFQEAFDGFNAKIEGFNILLVSVRDILLQKRVSLTHTPDIVRVFQKETQAQEQHEFQKVKHLLFEKSPRDFCWPFAI